MSTQRRSDEKGIGILIVDDDAFTRKVVHRILTDLRYADVGEAESVESALALLQGKAFDLIITDVQMPGINGLELLRRVRSGLTEAPRDTRAIVLTSFSNTEVLGVALALDVNGFLVKPMKPGAVHDKITQAMAEHTSVKPCIGYESVNTDLCTLRAQPQSLPNPDSGEEGRGGDSADADLPRRRVALEQLQPGMQLRQHIVTSDGTLLLSTGHTLSQLAINRLLEIRSTLRDNSIWILHENAEPAAP